MRRETSITAGTRRLVWWDRSLWFRTCNVGGFDGYQTLSGRRLPCDTLHIEVFKTLLQKDARKLPVWERPESRRTRIRLWKDRMIDRIGIALVEREHADLAERLWRMTGKW